MNTFKNGDRVTHNLYGSATVAESEPDFNLVVIVPDSGANPVQVHPMSLVSAPKFKIGDRVSHPLHRDGIVYEVGEHNGFVRVDIGGNRAYMAFPNQITHAVPEPTYHICIEEITGAAHVPGSLTAKQVAEYITDEIDWRVVQEIKITKE